MMSEGFITTCSHYTEEPDADFNDTRLRVEDMRITNNDADEAIEIFIVESAHTLSFTLPQARMLAEALEEILKRYPEKIDENRN